MLLVLLVLMLIFFVMLCLYVFQRGAKNGNAQEKAPEDAQESSSASDPEPETFVPDDVEPEKEQLNAPEEDIGRGCINRMSIDFIIKRKKTKRRKTHRKRKPRL